MARTLETQAILAMCQRQKSSFSASFSDEAKHIYVLDILEANPATLEVRVSAPQGRSAPMNPDATWELTLWNQRGAYQTRVSKFEARDQSLNVKVHPKTYFMARRKNIRIPADSRNPSPVTFQFQGQRLEGFLVDLSLEGVGIEIEPVQGMEVGQFLHKGQSIFKGREIRFETARIVQRAWSKSRLRLGLVFQNLIEDEEETIRTVFNQSFGHYPGVSTVLDG